MRFLAVRNYRGSILILSHISSIHRRCEGKREGRRKKLKILISELGCHGNQLSQVLCSHATINLLTHIYYSREIIDWQEKKKWLSRRGQVTRLNLTHWYAMKMNLDGWIRVTSPHIDLHLSCSTVFPRHRDENIWKGLGAANVKTYPSPEATIHSVSVCRQVFQ